MILNWNPDLRSLFKHTEDAQEEQVMRVKKNGGNEEEGMKKKLEENPSPQVATYISRLLPQGLLSL